MATEVKLPRLGQGMEEGKILQWLKSEGDTIEKGDDLYEVETEKVNVEVEAPASGTILKINTAAGDVAPIGTIIAWIGEAGESVPEASAPEPAPAKSEAAAPKAESKPAPAAAPAPAAKPAAPTNRSTDRIKASPLARRMAKEQGIELSELAGSGPDGRIVARDITANAAVASSASSSAGVVVAPSGEGVERIELTSMRKTIARRLSESWSAPVFYLTRDIDMTATNDLRKQMLGRLRDGDVRPTVSDILTKAIAVALRQHKAMNAHMGEDAIYQFDTVNIGMAVATDAGLVVPVIRDAHAKTVREIASDRSRLVGLARDGRLMPDDFEGGTFSISNLGMMGIDEFTAILNPPMVGILAVGQTIDKPVVRDRRVEIQPTMTVTLGCDHRAVDGAVGARFLQTLAEHLEDPSTML